jgi:chemotaxis family two-component system response regulator Rcp1
VRILLIEDNPGDARLMEEAFKESPVPVELSVVETGEQALAFLRREGAYAEAVRPDLVLLDLNLPRKDGREVLTELRADPALRDIPVVIVTSSLAKPDRQQAAALGVERFLPKPIDLDEYFAMAREIAEFWETRGRPPAP